MRHSLPIRLLLIIALLFSQLGGLVHGISHAMAEQSKSTDQSLPHDKLCDLCAAYAQLGAALGIHTILFTPAEQGAALAAASFDTGDSSDAFTAFAARAPPYSA